jgi:hypothetical protein
MIYTQDSCNVYLVLGFGEGAPFSFLAGKDDFLFLRGKARDKSGLTHLTPKQHYRSLAYIS